MAQTRRERYRQQTVAEIKSTALAQLELGGEAGVSLNAIARTMAMSPAALYRYFANRDDLLAELAVDAYGSLADHVEQAAHAVPPRTRFRAGARAVRDWALANPHAYRLIFETTAGSGMALASERIVPAAQRTMDVLLAGLAGAVVDPAPAPARQLGRELEQWAARGGHDDVPVPTVRLALVTWTRVHGLLSLELGGHLDATGITPALLFESELDALEQSVTRLPARRAP